MMLLMRWIACAAIVSVFTFHVATNAQANAVIEMGAVSDDARDRDKTGTNAVPENNCGSQAVANQPLTSRVSFEAEGKGFEPSTGFPAPDFESGR